MSAFECYQHYIALKNHFTQPSYDYFKYQGKTKASFAKFETRKDKLFFQKVAKHPEPISFMLSNLLENNKAWIRDIAYSEEASRIYQDHQKRLQSLTYTFKNDLSKLNDDYFSNFTGTNPHVIKLYMQGEISLETLAILADTTTGSIDQWDEKLACDPTWEPISTKLKKYIPFLQYDKKKYRKIILDKFTKEGDNG
jgi:T4 gene Gp59 loader of gp41 DNA helicase